MVTKQKSLKELLWSDIEKAFHRTIAEVDGARGKLELVTPDRYEAVYELIKDGFITDEPLSKSVGLTWTTDFENLFKDVFSHNLSFVLVDRESGNLMGLRATTITTQEKHIDVNTFKDDAIRKIFTFFAHCSASFNVHEKYNVDEIVEFLGLCVAKKYRQRGIGSFMIDVALKFIRNLGVSPCFIKTTATSNYSKKIFGDHGFEFLEEFPYASYTVNGDVVFKNTGEHKSMNMYKLSL